MNSLIVKIVILLGFVVNSAFAAEVLFNDSNGIASKSNDTGINLRIQAVTRIKVSKLDLSKNEVKVRILFCNAEDVDIFVEEFAEIEIAEKAVPGKRTPSYFVSSAVHRERYIRLRKDPAPFSSVNSTSVECSLIPAQLRAIMASENPAKRDITLAIKVFGFGDKSESILHFELPVTLEFE